MKRMTPAGVICKAADRMSINIRPRRGRMLDPYLESATKPDEKSDPNQRIWDSSN